MDTKISVFRAGVLNFSTPEQQLGVVDGIGTHMEGHRVLKPTSTKTLLMSGPVAIFGLLRFRGPGPHAVLVVDGPGHEHILWVSH